MEAWEPLAKPERVQCMPLLTGPKRQQFRPIAATQLPRILHGSILQTRHSRGDAAKHAGGTVMMRDGAVIPAQSTVHV